MYLCHVFMAGSLASTREAEMANLRTKILDFRVFDSSIILISRGEILMSIDNLLDTLSQAVLAGIILLGSPVAWDKPGQD